MKFSRYLQDNQTPEWKKAYIDYPQLILQLGLIRAQALLQVDTSSSFGNADVDHIDHADHNIEVEDNESEEDLSRGIATSTGITNLWASEVEPTANGFPDSAGHVPGSSTRWRTDNHERIPSFSLAMASLPHITGTALNTPPQPTPLPSNTPRPPVSSRLKNLGSHFPSIKVPSYSSAGFTGTRLPLPLHTILSGLSTTRAKFFDMLDVELGKVMSFYAEREKEMHERAKLLRRQLDELEVHRQIFHESSARLKEQSWARRAGLSVSLIFSSLVNWFHNTKPEESRQAGGQTIIGVDLGRGGRPAFADIPDFGTRGPEYRRMGGDHSGPRKIGGKSQAATEKNPFITSSTRVLDNATKLPSKRSVGHPSVGLSGTMSSHDPHGYRHAKRRLQKAVAEHYRGLEILDNYRTLNLTGFRKALRKYEKITKTSVLDAYVKEKVEPSILVSSATVGALLKEMEHLFATRFEHGNIKRAKDRLRVGLPPKTHDLTTFRSGVWLGLAIPAFGAGCYLSLQEYTRKTLPSWDILLLIYSTFCIPAVMALLIGINIFAWMRNKINHVFIFKLNPRLRHDYQEYFQLPSFFLCTLAYGFWFSMAQLGPPMLWPLLWLLLTLAIMLNPIHSFMWGATRWWTVKKIAKLGVSGIWNVEFIDLWLGDQFCSLVYPISNLYFVGCFYAHSSILSSAHDPQARGLLTTCGKAQKWGWYFLLGMLPFLVRFVQSLRRYRDSKLLGQLVNGGKYGMGMIQLFFYCYWRHQEMPRTGEGYVLFCFASTVNSLYAYAWDVAVDWSMCQPYARYPLLRRELAYKSHILLYYFALVFDLLIRFIWLTYILFDGASIELRSVIAAMLEMLRRVQWNFYRVENKHLCNMEEYRVTRELPLPYHFDAHPTEEEVYIARLQLRKRLARLS